MEETLIILKPDCMKKRVAGEVISRFEKAGFEIVASKVMQLDGPILREHYAHVADKPFFPEIEEFMSSRPVMPMILRGEDVIAKVRDLLGPTNSQEAAKGTIRGDLGTDMMQNVVHASDSPEAAADEKKRFFPEL
ncbi:nucleoside-diphosphate kinase [Coraliomargarita algicola]|uniref:Nucleoside diphosphate kinase n=1 Tax=Coraliomargarita algicola TaxID=3092156 RepID=A0ABZ0RJA8_9BACT|nr:nucleoside-diphosphate kinase [Coraliomargarita sp. J2-16]WPJ95491.1 nucleoside-diphosphate kinase [Coraliomargarita sp. J2-16]